MPRRQYHLLKSNISKLAVFWLLVFSLVQILHGQTQKKTEEAVNLELGKSLEREFAGGLETHGYRVKLTAGQYLKIIVEQRAVDVSAQLLAANENLITGFDNEFRLRETERIEFVAEEAGEFRLDVKTKYKSAAGVYEIRLTELRAATKRDRLLFEAHTLNAKASDLIAAGKYSESAPLVARALEIGEQQLGTEDARVGHFLNNLGFLQRQQGNFAAAETTLRRALAINEKALGSEHPQTIYSIRALGLVYRSANDFAKADKMFRQALAATEKIYGKEHPKIVDLLTDFAVLLADLKDSEQGERILQRALAVAEKHYEPDSLTIAFILNNLGVNYQEKGENERAEPFFRRVLAIYEKTIGAENDRYSNALQNIGIVLRSRKDYSQALEVYERALAIREKTLGREHLNLTPLLHNIANVHHSRGNYAKALETQYRALDIAEKGGGPHHNYTVQSLRNVARFYAAQGDAANAVRFQTLAEERTETALALNLAIGSERQKLLQLDEMAERTSRTISLNVNLAPDNPQASALAALVVLQRKGRVLDAMSDNLDALRGRFGIEDQKLLDALNSLTAQLAKLTLNKPPKMTLDEQRNQIWDLEEKKESLEAAISDHSQEFRVQSQPVTLASVQAEIPLGSALVEFAVYKPYNPQAQSNNEAYGSPRYVAYVLRRTGDVKWVELGDAQAIETAIEEWRKALRDPKRKDAPQLARRLDEKIMQPVRRLAGDVRQFLISPDGELNLIPFEALVDEAKKFLIESYSFTYLTGGRDLLRMRAARTSRSEFLLIAAPLFGEPIAEPPPPESNKTAASRRPNAKRRSLTAARNLSETYFAPLSGSLAEAQAIRKLFPETIFVTGAQATESALKKIVAPRILHIATHGFFLENADADSQSASRGSSAAVKIENPLARSGIALAGANRRADNAADDGILTALEASGLNLWGTELVVLSACDTGLGEVKNGEGVYGLRRAFTLAGTQSLVMSLWSVSDAVTRDLMIDYYKNLKYGNGRGASLRQVQLAMLKRKGREHPFYWASFIQSGEWANLDGKR
ncbi:MAG: CHAT domain-containing protein [Pyrinomonadaceae bacterium]|nr:CHAT domain-containing protein [Pyrinomonadaceae bacterium]